MTEPVQPDEEASALDERYRRASAADPSRPSETTRVAILAHARAVAEAHRASTTPAFDRTRPAANDRYWWRTAVAGVAIAGLALMIWTPRFQTDGSVAPTSAPADATQSSSTASAPQASPAPAAARLQAPTPEAPSGAAGEAGDEPVSDATMMAKVPMPSPVASPPPTAATAPGDRERPSSLDRATAEQASRKPEPGLAPYAGAPAAAAGASPSEQLADALRSRRLDEAVVTAGRARAPAAQSSIAPAPVTRQAMAPAAPTDAAGDPGSALRAAADAGDAARARALVAAGAPLESRDAGGRTALLLAVAHDRPELVRVLLEAGADVNARDAAGQSALDIAHAAGHGDLAALLEARGAR